MAKKSSFDMTDTSEFKPEVEEVFVPEPEPEVKVEPVPEPVVETWPKKYVCKVKCWASGRCQMYSPGDVVEFGEGERIPSHFEQI